MPAMWLVKPLADAHALLEHDPGNHETVEGWLLLVKDRVRALAGRLDLTDEQRQAYLALETQINFARDKTNEAAAALQEATRMAAALMPAAKS